MSGPWLLSTFPTVSRGEVGSETRQSHADYSLNACWKNATSCLSHNEYEIRVLKQEKII